MEWKTLALVAAGGAVGATLRAAITQVFTAIWSPAAIPLATLAANGIGCLAMGLLLQAPLVPALRWGVLTGILGAFTTFSTFSADAAAYANNERWTLATTYVLITVILALSGFALGTIIGRRIFFS